MRLLLFVLVATAACGKSTDDKPKPTTDQTQKVPLQQRAPADDPPNDQHGRASAKPGDHPMKKLQLGLPDHWSSSYYESRRAHTVMATLPGRNAVELLVMLLPPEIPPRLDDFIATVANSDTLDQYESITRKDALADGFIVYGKQPHAAYPLSISRARRVGGAWLYCGGSFPDEPSREIALEICDSAEFPGAKARLPAEDRQLYVPASGTSGVRVRWLWSETTPMIFDDARAELSAVEMTERSERIAAVWNELRTQVGTEGTLGETFTAILAAIEAVYSGDEQGLLKRVKTVEALLTNLD